MNEKSKKLEKISIPSSKKRLKYRPRKQNKKTKSDPSENRENETPTTNETKVKEIPGYYYDPNLKKYFKINPELRRKLQEQKQLEERQAKANDVAQSMRKIHVDNVIHPGMKDSPIYSLSRHIMGRELGLSCGYESSSTRISVIHARKYQLESKFYLFHGISAIEKNPNEDTIVMGSSRGSAIIWQNKSNLETFNCSNDEITSIRFPSIENSICSLSSFGSEHSPGKLYVCYYDNSTHSICLQKGALWTHEWNHSSSSVVLGVSKMALLTDMGAEKTVSLLTRKSDVFALQWTENDKGILCGSRDGIIRLFDIREKPCYLHNFHMKHSSSICCMKLLRDENYLVASSRDGMIHTWDRRVCKPVMSIQNYNDSQHILFAIDSTEEFLYSGSIDLKLRVWSLRNGELLQTIDELGRNVQALCVENVQPTGLPKLYISTANVLHVYSVL